MTRTTHPVLAAIALLALAASGTALAQQPAEAVYGDDYRTGDYGRVRDAERGLTVVRTQWNHEQGVADEGGLNSPIFPGDRVTTALDQRVEVELAGGTLVWIDRRSELTFLALPDPYAEVADHAVLQLVTGRVRLAATLREGEELRIDTPVASVYPLGDADVRVEVAGGGRTLVSSRRGVVEVVGGGGSVLVRGGMRTEVDPGELPYQPEPFNTFSGDGFDRYVEQREAAYEYSDYAGDSGAYRDLPDEVRPYYRELSAYGEWVYVDDYGYLWQPAGVAADWRPYHHGYWGYGPHGYFWVSHEPWGWGPYHYGRWTWIGGHGWCWSPGRIFAGAWVSWSWGSVYVGWSPLDYWNYPAYHSVLHYGYYDPFSWTFVSYRHFHHHDYLHYSVSWDHVRHEIQHNAVVTRPPREGPRRLAVSVEARRRALRDVRERAHGQLRRKVDARPTRRSFRQAESRGVRRGDGPSRLRREASAPPAGRERTAPLSSRRRGPSARDAERGRERLPVVTRPRSSRHSPGSSATRAPSTSSERGPRRGLRPETESRGPGREAARQGVSGRVRDIYRKMAKPRQTRERSEASKSSSGPGSGHRAQPSKPGRPRPKSTPPSGRARPKSSSGGEKKKTKARSGGAGRGERSSRQMRRSPGSSSHVPAPRARGSSGTPAPRSVGRQASPSLRRGSPSVGSSPTRRPLPSQSRRSARPAPRRRESPSASRVPSGRGAPPKARRQPSHSKAPRGRSVSRPKAPSKPSRARGSGSRGSRGGSRRGSRR